MDTTFENAFADDCIEFHDTDLSRGEADHRIANSLSIAASVLRQQEREVTDMRGAKAAMTATASRLMAMARLHRTLCRPASTELMDLGDFFASLSEDVSGSLGIKLDVTADGVVLQAGRAAQIGIVVTEMAVNAVKHGGRDDRKSVLTVEADMNRLGGVRLRIYDGGRGFPESFDLDMDEGFGFAIIRAAVGRLDGSVRVLPRFGPYLLTGAGLEIILPPQGPRPS